MTSLASAANIDQLKAWDGDEGDHWTEHEEHYNAVGRRYDPHLLRAASIVDGDRVLDIGCGCGLLTREAARRTPSGTVLGVDLSRRMIERARHRARGEDLHNVAFLQADAQTEPFERGGYELAVSRFGAMFFSQPVTAFTNLRTALAAGGRLALLAWQALDRNEWVFEVREALAAGRDLPGPPPNLPGPFGLAVPAHTHRVLQDSGFIDIDIEGVHEPLWFGADIDEALAFISGLGMARALLHDLDESSRRNALARLRDLLVDHATADGVTFASSAWMVTARLTDSRSR